MKVWARDQGFTSCLQASAMHVTVAFDRQLHDWNKLPLIGPKEIIITEPDERSVAIFKGGACVLEVYSTELTTRWAELVQSGLYWRWNDYRPHITITYNIGPGFRPSKILPYPGVIVLGEEHAVEVSQTWVNSLDEEPL